MRVAERRKVVEVLLCCAQHADSVHTDATWDTCKHLWHPRFGVVAVRANHEWNRARTAVDVTVSDGSHSTACLEAAYRLIESSPTLRREWFGAQ